MSVCQTKSIAWFGLVCHFLLWLGVKLLKMEDSLDFNSHLKNEFDSCEQIKINHCWLFNAKSCFYINIKHIF